MSRNANPDIGHIPCPFTGEQSPLRRYRTGQRLAYFMSPAGKIAPNLPAGQLYILKHGVFNDPEDQRQIARWLESRGIPAQPGGSAQAAPAPAEPAPGMVETVIGGSDGREPEAVTVEGGADPQQPAPVPTPAREGGFLSRFWEGDEE